MEVLVFGGTLEGRELVEWLSARATCEVVACTATEYGGELVSGLPRVTPLVGPLDAKAKQRLVDGHAFACIVDATHPYATHVTQSIAALAGANGLPLVRLARADDTGEAVGDQPCTFADDVPEAARAAAAAAGNVLLTTGTKDLAAFTQAIPDFKERLYARVLPVPESVAHARGLGLPASHIVAVQGPFSADFNAALMRELSIDVVVTKASGAAGGFAEKVEAARRCGARLVVVGRPKAEQGFSLEGAKRELEVRYGA